MKVKLALLEGGKGRGEREGREGVMRSNRRG
jgi:hypothetical protein